jgi:hypothetical protein
MERRISEGLQMIGPDPSILDPDVVDEMQVLGLDTRKLSDRLKNGENTSDVVLYKMMRRQKITGVVHDLLLDEFQQKRTGSLDPLVKKSVAVRTLRPRVRKVVLSSKGRNTYEPPSPVCPVVAHAPLRRDTSGKMVLLQRELLSSPGL